MRVSGRSFLNFTFMDEILRTAEAEFVKVIEHLRSEFSKLQIGRASASLVEGIQVEAYGSRQPLKSLANVSVPDAKTVQIQPWDKSLLAAVEKAIQQSDLHLNPLNDGMVIRLSIPPLTEERRRDIVKVVSRMAEEARISVRHVRQSALDGMKQKEKAKEVTEDQVTGFEKKLQDKVDHVNIEIETTAKHKENDVMTV